MKPVNFGASSGPVNPGLTPNVHDPDYISKLMSTSLGSSGQDTVHLSQQGEQSKKSSKGLIAKLVALAVGGYAAFRMGLFQRVPGLGNLLSKINIGRIGEKLRNLAKPIQEAIQKSAEKAA